jgi:hypothetical protein
LLGFGRYDDLVLLANVFTEIRVRTVAFGVLHSGSFGGKRLNDALGAFCFDEFHDAMDRRFDGLGDLRWSRSCLFVFHTGREAEDLL